MSEILSRIKASNFTGFADLFDPEEGRMGVAVTFIAILELLKESVIDVVQSDEYAPLHVRVASTVHLATEDGEQVDLPVRVPAPPRHGRAVVEARHVGDSQRAEGAAAAVQQRIQPSCYAGLAIALY